MFFKVILNPVLLLFLAFLHVLYPFTVPSAVSAFGNLLLFNLNVYTSTHFNENKPCLIPNKVQQIA